MRNVRKWAESGIYHVIQRGVGRQIIFEEEQDYCLLSELLCASFEAHGVELLCYCFMSNHFHLLVRGDRDDLSEAMKIACGTYAQRFNEKYDRVGHLFQGRFKSEPIDDEAYLLTVVRYIHQNPVVAGICSSCGEYAWSSYNRVLAGSGLSDGEAMIADLFGSLSGYVEYHKELVGKGACVEAFAARRGPQVFQEEDVLRIAEERLGKGAIESLKGWDKPARNRAIKTLGDAGLSVRQIERLTGVPRSTVSRLVRSKWDSGDSPHCPIHSNERCD
ncbi:MAG: transposase [Coriobacteriales bacterium]